MHAYSKHIRFTTYFVLAGVLLYGYGLLLTGAYFSHPNVEDFSLCATPKNYGIAYGIQDLLLNYDGRYFTNFLHAINPLAFGCIDCFKWVIAFNTLFPILCLYYFFRSLPSPLERINSALFAALLVLTNLAMSPSLVHQIYWMVSSFVYHYSFCLYLIWLGAILRFLKEKSIRKKWMLFVFASVILVADQGINEMILVINGASLLALLYYSYHLHKDSFNAILAFSANGLVAMLFFLSNPGISNRMDIIGTQAESNAFVKRTLKGISDYGLELFEFGTYAGLIVPLIFLFYAWGNKSNNNKLKWTLVLLFAGITTLLFTTMTFYLPMGHEPNTPHRIYTSIFWAMLLLFVLMGARLLGNVMSDREANVKTINILTLLSASIFTAFILFGNHNLKQLKTDFSSGAMASYDKAMQIRYQLLAGASASNEECWSTASLAPLHNPPKSISHSPYIQPNREEAYWNEAYEKFFLIEEVKLEGDSQALHDFLQISPTP